jgi:hypothetical protein
VTVGTAATERCADGSIRRRGLYEASRVVGGVTELGRFHCHDGLILQELTGPAVSQRGTGNGRVVAAVAPESETGREVLDTGAGVVAPPERPNLLLKESSGLLTRPLRRERLGAAGKRFARTALSPEQAPAGLKTLVKVGAGSSAVGREGVSVW